MGSHFLTLIFDRFEVVAKNTCSYMVTSIEELFEPTFTCTPNKIMVTGTAFYIVGFASSFQKLLAVVWSTLLHHF